uniref:Uncharacterized protein n=1 Tax=Anguilla anguilla TaxID=7936 RepID=A0A0E9REV3_ANGAN
MYLLSAKKLCIQASLSAIYRSLRLY